MHATSTVLNIENRVNGRRLKLLVSHSRESVIPGLIRWFSDYEKDNEPCAVHAFLRITPRRKITITVTAADGVAAAERFLDLLALELGGPDNE